MKDLIRVSAEAVFDAGAAASDALRAIGFRAELLAHGNFLFRKPRLAAFCFSRSLTILWINAYGIG